MNESLLINDTIQIIDYHSEWKKTILYKITFGRASPSEAWKEQLRRLKKYHKNSFF